MLLLTLLVTKNCFGNYKYAIIKELNNLGGSGFARLHSKITHYPFNSNPFISFSLISLQSLYNITIISYIIVLLIVLCRGGESRLDGVGKLKFELFVKLTWYDVDFGHTNNRHFVFLLNPFSLLSHHFRHHLYPNDNDASLCLYL